LFKLGQSESFNTFARCLFFPAAPCARHHNTACASHTPDWILPQASEYRERMLAEEEHG
ncbi:uncharacterized, partial [Tachysurus ichikawai]